MTQGRDAVSRAIDAARAHDAEMLRNLIDWPLAAAADFSRALGRLPESLRAEVATDGLRELENAAARADVSAEYLAELAPKLSAARDIVVATEARRGEVLAIMQVVPTPSGLTQGQAVRLDLLRARAAQLRDVYIVDSGGAELAVAVTPDSGRLVPLLPRP